jgi:hypothetical protein
LGKIEENKGAKTIVFYEAKLPYKKKEPKRAKKRALIFQKTMRLCSARGLLGICQSWKILEQQCQNGAEPGRAGNGKRVCF